jgi:outer membrane protein
MLRAILVLVTFSFLLPAEVHRMTLRQAVDLAMKQNPDVAMARLDAEKARQAVRVAKDPFAPRITVGSGLAYSNGFPLSIEGSAPSIVQAQAAQYLFNRPQSYAVAQAKENARGASLGVAGKRDEVGYRIASLFLDAERAARVGDLARKDADSQGKVLDTVTAQVQEGRALPLTQKTAAYQLAAARELADNLDADRETAETALAIALGFSAEDRVVPAPDQRPAPALPASEAQAMETALSSNVDLRRLESQVSAKQLELRGARASRLPRIDLVAQYGLFAKFNHYEDYFRSFQRNNGEIGVAVQLPLLTGPGVSAQTAQAQSDIARLRIELANTRNRLSADLQQAFRDTRKAQTAAEVARLDLEVAREQLSVDLAQMQEGRLALRDVEEARIVENRKWIAFYDAQYTVERARWNVLRLTGELVPSIEKMP